jgi:hypothetical protein
MKLPPGRAYSSGKAFIPPVKRDLVDKLAAIFNVAGDESQAFKLAHPPGQTPEQEGNPEEAKVRTLSPVTFGLPRSWDSIQPGRAFIWQPVFPPAPLTGDVGCGCGDASRALLFAAISAKIPRP